MIIGDLVEYKTGWFGQSEYGVIIEIYKDFILVDTNNIDYLISKKKIKRIMSVSK